MKNLLLLVLVLLALFACLTDSQTSKPRTRTKSRNRKNKKAGNCHLKAIDVCLDKVEAVTNNRSSAALIKTAEGISKLCKYVNAVELLRSQGGGRGSSARERVELKRATYCSRLFFMQNSC